ncbi:hypothetical protein Ancab_010399, partial [Ancistrocladus abbreviatus]
QQNVASEKNGAAGILIILMLNRSSCWGIHVKFKVPICIHALLPDRMKDVLTAIVFLDTEK